VTEAVIGEAAPQVEARDAPVVTSRYRTYALILLMAINAVNILDRMVITNLIEPIKEDLKLTDAQVGAMAGIYFAIVYTVLGIPVARWADRGDRPKILALALTIWSGFSLLGGFAQNFATLVVSRMGVGVGEAGCSPTAHSLLSEYTPREKRAVALSIYAIGSPIGVMLGMGLGAVVAESYGWRTAFLVAGAPGLLLAVIALFSLKEPRRALRSAGALAARAAEHVPMRAVLRVLARKPTFWFFALGSALYALVAYAHSHFLASYFLRSYTPQLTELAASFGMQPRGFLGTSLGLISGVGGIFGSLVGGWFADKYGAKDLRWYGVLPAVFPILSTPILWWALSTANLPLAFGLLIVPTIGHALWYGPVYGGVQGLVPPGMRATAAAVLLFVMNMIGMGGGPTLFGIANDAMTNHYLAGAGLSAEACQAAMGQAKAACGAVGAQAIRSTMLWSTAIMILPMILFWLSRRTIRQDMES
jgi:predicted MFS family arabinose efflux permease